MYSALNSRLLVSSGQLTHVVTGTLWLTGVRVQVGIDDELVVMPGFLLCITWQ